MTGKDGIYDIDESVIAEAPNVLRRMHWSLAGMELTSEIRRAYGLPTIEQEEDLERLKSLTNKQGSVEAENKRLADKKGSPLTAEETKKLLPEEVAELETLRARDDLDITPVKAIRIPNTHHDYTVARNHLVPYYRPEKESLSRRKETKIVARSRSWIINALPQVNVPWTAKDIDLAMADFEENLQTTNPNDPDALNERSAEFRLIFGAIMTRFELLGRAITQGNTYGTKSIGFPKHDQNDKESPMLPMDIQPIPEGTLDNEQLSPEQIKILEAEYAHYSRFLLSSEVQPLLRHALLKDMKIDRDGILIDYLREVGKPIRVKMDSQERYINDLIVDKVGSAMQSIDETHEIVKRAMTQGASGKLFKEAADEFIQSHGAEYNLRDMNDIIRRLDDYATLCKARVGVKGEDAEAYFRTYAKLSSFEAFFNGQNGLLQSIKRASRGHSKDVAELRQLTTRGIKLMLQTAYTRVPSNADAPSVWIPNLDENAPPLERHLTRQFLIPEERQQAQEVFKAAKEVRELAEQASKDKGDPEKIIEDKGESAANRFLKQQFCSVGCLEREARLLEASIEANSKKAAKIGKRNVPAKRPSYTAAASGGDEDRGPSYRG